MSSVPPWGSWQTFRRTIISLVQFGHDGSAQTWDLAAIHKEFEAMAEKEKKSLR